MGLRFLAEGRSSRDDLDNLLFTTIGILTGFISGYFTHEVMAVRQPPSLAVLQAAQAAALGGAHADGVPSGATQGRSGANRRRHRAQ